jgi:phosphate:Na+ symporter
MLMIMDFDIWALLAGIGIFLFGIYLLEESLKSLSGKTFKTFIRRYTSTRLKSILSGTLATGVLQSSSAVSLMILAFVGAGIMSLTNAFGVILGSNLGTTLTSWIVASIGFKFNIESFALPFIGMGGLGLIFFGRSTRAANISKLMVGFGFLFLGIDYMKTSVVDLTATFDMRIFSGYNIVFFVLIGFVITAVMQSSSAAMAIILTALHSDILNFHNASAMVVGTNLGTTVTVLLGSIGGVIAKKQVAAGHFIFNFVTAISILLILQPLNYFLLRTLGLQDEPVIALALFHTMFNAFGVILFFPFIRATSSIIVRVIKDEKKYVSVFIHNTSSEVPEAALAAIKSETIFLIRLVMIHNLELFQLNKKLISLPPSVDRVETLSGGHEIIYSRIKSIQSELFLFSSQLQMHQLTKDEAVLLSRMVQALLSGVASAKTLKDISHELLRLDQSEKKILNELHMKYRNSISNFYAYFEELIDENERSLVVNGLVKSINKIEIEDRNSIKSLTHYINSTGLKSEEISSLLATSRSFSLSLKQIVHSMKELLLSKEEADIYEKLTLNGEEISNAFPSE